MSLQYQLWHELKALVRQLAVQVPGSCEPLQDAVQNEPAELLQLSLVFWAAEAHPA